MPAAKKPEEEHSWLSKLGDGLLYVTAVGAFGLASWGATIIADLRTKVEVLQNELEIQSKDTREAERIQASLHKHWKLHNWARDEITEIRAKASMPPSRWPDLPE